MNGFLVLFCGSCDDIPVALVATREQADAIANSIVGYEDPRVRHGGGVLGRDFSTQCVVDVVEFHDGIPVKSWPVKDLSDYPAADDAPLTLLDTIVRPSDE